MMKKTNGFTVIELAIVTAIVCLASVLVFMQKQNLEVVASDNIKKTAINSMYYSLEKVFYVANGYYPQTISSANLTSVDPALFTDPQNIKLGDAGSAYSYTPTNCIDNKCKSYTLKATLNNENDYIKSSDSK